MEAVTPRPIPNLFSCSPSKYQVNLVTAILVFPHVTVYTMSLQSHEYNPERNIKTQLASTSKTPYE